MPDTTSPPALPQQRPASAGEWDGPDGGFVASRYHTGGDGSGGRITGVALAAVVLLAAAIVIVPGTVGPGLGIAAVGVGTALVLAGLNSPAVAIVLLVVTMFFRQGLKIEALPAEPYLFAFAGVLGAGGVALSRHRSRAPQFGVVEGVMAMFLFWAIASAVFPHKYHAGDGNPVHYFILLSIVVPFVLYIVGRSVIDNERTIRVLVWAFIAIFAYSVWHSILQFHAKSLAWPNTVADFSEGASWANRALGVFGNPVENGFVLVVGFLLALYMAKERGARPLPKLVLYLLVIASLYAIFLTRTRVVYAVFVVALIIGVLAIPRIRAICGTLLGLGSLLVVAAYPILLSDDRNAGGLTSSYEIQDRLNMAATGWWALKQNPIVGWGIARFADVNTYHHKQWSQDVPWFRGYGIKAHINELGIAVELGLIGLALWVTILVLVGRKLKASIRALENGTGGFAGRELAVLFASIAALWVVVGLTVDLRYLSVANALTWLLAGVAVGMGERAAAGPTAGPAFAPPAATTATPEHLDEDEELYLRWVAQR
ncbi:MAG: O-antigen ligase family protein [Pseudonocardia sp.]